MDDLTLQRRSPLAGFDLDILESTGDRQVVLTERPYLTMVGVRLDPGLPTASAVAGVLGAELPRSCGQVATAGDHSVLWLGPDEWLVVSTASPQTLIDGLTDAVEGVHAAVVDVSANRTLLELSGPAARSVLEKGCPVDLHARAFQPGMAVSTTLARIPLLLWQTGPETYRLMPRSSFAEYVARWLLDAMREFAPDVPEGAAS